MHANLINSYSPQHLEREIGSDSMHHHKTYLFTAFTHMKLQTELSWSKYTKRNENKAVENCIFNLHPFRLYYVIFLI